MQISLWETESFYRPSDILIVGAGFGGLWTAYELKKKKPSLSITVIDRGIIPTGASTRNAGFSCFGSLTELLYDAKTFGEEKMISLAAQRYEGLRHIRETFRPSDIDYKEYGGYELLTEHSTYDVSSDLRLLNKMLKDAFGEKELFRLADKKIKKFGFSGVTHLVENKLEGQLHPGKLTATLLYEIEKRGVRVFFGVEATRFEQANGQVHVHTAEQVTLQAKQLVICTNAFNALVPEVPVQPARGQVLVTSPIEGLPFKGTFHYDEGFVYFRNVGKRVLLGGARNKFFDQENTSAFVTTENVQHELERLLREMILPGKDDYTIEHRWSGIIGLGRDKGPALKQLQPNVHCAIAMGGIGVAMAPVMARQVTALLLDKKEG